MHVHVHVCIDRSLSSYLHVCSTLSTLYALEHKVQY